jgi:hypothetical protein
MTLNQSPSNNSAFQGLKSYRFLVCGNCLGAYPIPEFLYNKFLDEKQKSWRCPSCKYVNTVAHGNRPLLMSDIWPSTLPWRCPDCSLICEKPRYVDVTRFIKLPSGGGCWKPLFPKRRSYGWRWLKCPHCGSAKTPTTGHNPKRSYKPHVRSPSKRKIWTPDLYYEVGRDYYLRKIPLSRIVSDIYVRFKAHRISVAAFIVYHLRRARYWFRYFRRFQLLRDRDQSSSSHRVNSGLGVAGVWCRYVWAGGSG